MKRGGCPSFFSQEVETPPRGADLEVLEQLGLPEDLSYLREPDDPAAEWRPREADWDDDADERDGRR